MQSYLGTATTRTPPPPHVHYDPYLVLDLVTRTHGSDTVEHVAREFDNVFERRPDLPDSMAIVLRAMALELYLAGIDKHGHKVQVAAAGNGIRVFPRFEDGRLAQIAAAFEYVSRHPRCHHA